MSCWHLHIVACLFIIVFILLDESCISLYAELYYLNVSAVCEPTAVENHWSKNMIYCGKKKPNEAFCVTVKIFHENCANSTFLSADVCTGSSCK